MKKRYIEPQVSVVRIDLRSMLTSSLENYRMKGTVTDKSGVLITGGSMTYGGEEDGVAGAKGSTSDLWD